ncbi:MAG: tetratricopeptide repeat protein [Chthoniobacterales bacterium]
MRIISLSSPLQQDRSFRIALGIIVAFAAAEIIAASWHYLGATRTVAAAPPQSKVVAASLAPPPPVAAPAPSIPRTLTTPPPLSLSEQILVDAVALRDRGDTANALARLQEASEREPANAKILEELAKTYEAMQNIDRSTAIWRKIQEMGPAAGTSFELADQRLKLGLPVAATSNAGLPGPSRLDNAASLTDPSTMSDGTNLGITEATVSETPDAEADTNLQLRLGIKKRTSAVLDHTRVKIQVFFYDTVDDKDIKLTDAEVTYEWLTPDHDWAKTEPEVLQVNYLRPKSKLLSSEAALSAAAASVNPGKKTRASKPAGEGQRKYLGYIVRVYYQDKLEAVKAEPARLLKLYPPSSTASP